MTRGTEMDVNAAGSLLDFERPPVVETSIGFHFSPVPGWSQIHVGALWQEFRVQYPKTEYRPPLSFPADAQKLIQDISSDLGKIPIRTFFIDDSSTRLVQIQNGFFFHNWRKTVETPEYQHYRGVCPTFRRDWQRFCRFLGSMAMPMPDVSRCEVTYFNHLVRGEDWTDVSEFGQMFPFWRLTEVDGPLSLLEAAPALSLIYKQADGAVQTVVSPGIRQTDGKEVMQLTITGFAKPSGSSEEELFTCLDGCHRNAARVFVKVVGEELQARWGRTR